MMDAETVIQQAKAGTAPADWQTLPAKSSFFVWSAIGGIVFTFFAVLAAGYLFLTGSFVGIGVNDQTPDTSPSSGSSLIWSSSPYARSAVSSTPSFAPVTLAPSTNRRSS